MITASRSTPILALILFGCTTPIAGVDPQPAIGPGSGNDPIGDDDDGDDPFDPATDWEDTGDPMVHPDLVQPEQHACLVDVDVPEDRQVLTFHFDCDPSDAGIEPGMYVVGIEDGGYLRQVDSVSVDGWSITAVTSFASLADIVANDELHLDIGSGERGTLPIGAMTLFEGDGTEVKIAGGEVGFDYDLDYDARWGWWRLKSADIEMVAGPRASLDIEVSASEGLDQEWERTVGSREWPFYTQVGVVPVTGTVRLVAKVGIAVTAQGTASATFGGGIQMPVRVEGHWHHDDGWSQDSSIDLVSTVDTPQIEVDAEVSVRAFLKLEPQILFYGVAGPGMNIEPYLEATADPACEGIEAAVTTGVDFKLVLAARLEDDDEEQGTLGMNWDLGGPSYDLWNGTLEWPLEDNPFCEVCDDGVDDDGDGDVDCADSDCEAADHCLGVCADGNEITCGQTATLTATDFAASSDSIDFYGCNVGNYEGPEVMWAWTSPVSGPVEWKLVDPEPTVTDVDVIVLDAALGCGGDACTTWGANNVEFEASAGTVYYLVVDGYNGATGDVQVELDCSP